MKRSRTIKLTLTLTEAQAIVDAVTDCAMEGLENDRCFEQTWGDDWEAKRPAAMRVSSRLHAKLHTKPRRR